tara:strand:- start:9212 stop:16375 length:7164 start_codon:yes stop_codon:yes gene_type:complete
MVETVVYQSRTCPSSQESIDETYNRTSPWEYDNPERNKADGCMVYQKEGQTLWGESNSDCDLPNYKVWRDSTIIGGVDPKKSIPNYSNSGELGSESKRSSQVLPEGKVFVFGSSSHPCTAESGCNATDGDWRKTQPWDGNAGCSWSDWASGDTSNCTSSEFGLSEGICPEGYKWSDSSDEDSWWSRGDSGHEHPIEKNKGIRKASKGSQFHDNIRFGVVPHSSFSENNAQIYWDLGHENGRQVQPQTGEIAGQSEEHPRMLDIRENCGNPDCSVVIGGNHSIRYKDGGLNHVNWDEQKGPSYTLEKCVAKRPWMAGEPEICQGVILDFKGNERADANMQDLDRVKCESGPSHDSPQRSICEYIPREEIPIGFIYEGISSRWSSGPVQDAITLGHASEGSQHTPWWPSNRIDEYREGLGIFHGGGGGLKDRWNHGRYSYCTAPDTIERDGNIIAPTPSDYEECYSRIHYPWRNVGISHEASAEERARCLGQAPRSDSWGWWNDFWGDADPGDGLCVWMGGPHGREGITWDSLWSPGSLLHNTEIELYGQPVVDYGYENKSYNPYGNSKTGPVIGLHSTHMDACDSSILAKNNSGMSMGAGTHSSNPYWNTDWSGWFHDGSRLEAGEMIAGSHGLWDVTGDYPGVCLDSWSSPTQITIEEEQDISPPGHPAHISQSKFDTTPCGNWWDNVEEEGHGSSIIECKEENQHMNHCSAEEYDDSDSCARSTSWLQGATDFSQGILGDEAGLSKTYPCSEWSKGGCGEHYGNQYKHMISDDYDESFGSWGLYDQGYHLLNPDTLGDYTRANRPDMAHGIDKITPKCFKTKDNYFKTDPINGVPIDSKFGYGENSPRKYVYRDWNPLLIVLELAQDLSRYDESDIEFDFDIELKGKGWGINRDGLTTTGEAHTDVDSGAVPGERRDFCQIHKSTDDDVVYESHIYDRRSTWRWGTDISTSEPSFEDYLECNVDVWTSTSGGSWMLGAGHPEDERAQMAYDQCSSSYRGNELINDLPSTILKKPDKTLKLRDCQEAGCVANGSLGIAINGCSYSKVLSYPGLHHFQDNSMDNTTKLLPDFSNLPIRDENDNLLYVRRKRTVYNSGSYGPDGTGETTTEYKAIPLYLDDDMLEELMIKYHKLLCCYGKLDWKLFSTLFCGFSPIFDRIIKSDGTDGKKTLDEQKCSDGDPDCDGSSHNRSSTDELVTGGFYFDVSKLAKGGRVQPSSSLSSWHTGDDDAEYMSDGDCEDYGHGCKRVGQSFITEPGLPLSGNKQTIKNGIEEGYYGVKDDSIPGRTRFPGLKLFSEKQAKYIKMAFDYLEGNYTTSDDEHFMGTYSTTAPWQDNTPALAGTDIEQNLSKYYTEASDTLYPEYKQKRGGANIYPGGDFISEENTWPRERNIDPVNGECSGADGDTITECTVNGGTWIRNVSFIDFIKTQNWFTNWDNIAKKQYCHEDYFKCDAIVYEEPEISGISSAASPAVYNWNINSSSRLDSQKDKGNAYPAFSEISEKCLSFINNDICPIPHRSSDGGGNKYCERLPISEQHAMGGGPEGSSRLAPPGIKMPEDWFDKSINVPGDSAGSPPGSENLSDLINTGNALTDVILSNKEGYGKYCINPIDPQYYRSNLCLDFCGNVGGEGGDASVITEDDQCINMIDNYCEDVFMGLKRGKTEYQLKYDYNSPCTSNDDCTSGQNRYCYTEIEGGKCGPSGTASSDWEWVNSESMLLDREQIDESSTPCSSNSDCSSNQDNPFCYYDIGMCGPSETYNDRQNKRGHDEIDFFELIGLNQETGNKLTGRNDTSIFDRGINHYAVFKDGSYYNEEMNDLFKWLFPSFISGQDESVKNIWGFYQQEDGDGGGDRRLDLYGCTPEAQTLGYCGLEYKPILSPMKDKIIPGSTTNELNNRIPGKENLIKDICIGHFPGYDITDKGGEKNWLYRLSEEDDGKDINFEDGLKVDLTMDKILSQDGLGVNEGDINPNFNPKLGEEENFYRWVVNKGPSLERLVDSGGVESVQRNSGGHDEVNSGSVIPDMYHRMKHFWNYLRSTSEVDYSTNFGDSDLLNALSYNRDFTRYLIHKYNRSKYNSYQNSLDLFEPDFGPHHLYNYMGVNYDDFDYGDMSLIDTRKTSANSIQEMNILSTLEECENSCNEDTTCKSFHYDTDTRACSTEHTVDKLIDIPGSAGTQTLMWKKDPFRIQKPGDEKDEGNELNWNMINRGVDGAVLPCYDPTNDDYDPATIWQCAQLQSLEAGSITARDDSTIEMNMNCSIQAEGARPCDVYACTQFQSLSARDGINLHDNAEIIQNMECSIGGSMIAPVVCPVDFDCSNSPNDLIENPTSKVCSSSTCSVDDCCTVSTEITNTNSETTQTEELLKENKVQIVLIIMIIIILFISFSSFILI